MAITGLIEKTTLADLSIGNTIKCEYVATSGVVGTFSNLGTAVKTDISIAGTATPNGSFNFICVDKKAGIGGIAIADRVIQHSVNWDVLNAGNMIEGKIINLNSTNILIRSLSGGVAYADTLNNLSTTNLSFGAFPTNNEWDKYITFSTLANKITANDINIWNHNTLESWVQETPALALGANTARIKRKNNSLVALTSSTASTTNGFRPVLVWREDLGNLI